jgi:beta-lactamase class A
VAGVVLSLLVWPSAVASRDFAPAQTGNPSLADRIRPLIEAHRGQVAVAVKNLDTGEVFVHRADEPMPTASLIKLAVMIEAYRQAAEGRIDLDAMVTLKESDKVPGAGVLTPHFSEGTTLRLRDAIRLMIAFSDNTATNLVLDRIGIASTGQTMKIWGYPNTTIHAKVYRRDTSIDPGRSARFGLGSTTASEMIALLEALHRRSMVSRQASEAMLEHLSKCDDKDKFPRFLPDSAKLAFKTGSVDDVRTAAGLLQTPRGEVALCVLTCQNEDRRWVADNAGNLLCAQVARAVYQHFGGVTE